MSDGGFLPKPAGDGRSLLAMRTHRSRRRRGTIAVADDLASITTVAGDEASDNQADLPPHVKGRIWSAVEGMYRTGLHPAIGLCIRRGGRMILNRTIGHARGNGPGEPGIEQRIATPDTPICLFSASKSISAMLLHKMVEQGRIALDDRIADYIPEYGCNGKATTTVRELLAHRAGIPSLPTGIDPSILNDFHAVVALLCATKAASGTGHQQSYHAITAGYIVGELVRRVSGRNLQDVLRKEIAEPLGCRFLSYGLEPKYRSEMALNYTTGRKPPFPFGWIARRALGVEFGAVAELSNEDAFLSSVIPAANIYATAEEACRFYEMLRNGGTYNGKQLFKRETVTEAVKPLGPITLDRTLFLPVRFSPAFVLGERFGGLYGPRCGRAFGHLGFINILTWADPDRDLSVALLNTGKSTEPAGLAALMRVLFSIGINMPPVAQCAVPALGRQEVRG